MCEVMQILTLFDEYWKTLQHQNSFDPFLLTIYII